MRINKYIALATGMSRRSVDVAIAQDRVLVNNALPIAGYDVKPNDRVSFDGTHLQISNKLLTIVLNKPVGYVVSRKGQGNKTIYDLLPLEYHHLKPVGRLDKDSSGLLLLTNNGELANQLTHPRYAKTKVYELELDKPLAAQHKAKIEKGILLDDGISRLRLESLNDPSSWRVTMQEGRNRQIRRTFAASGYEVKKLHRTHLGTYDLADLHPGQFRKN